MNKRNSGYTLIELILTIVIVLILFASVFGGCRRAFSGGSYSTGGRIGVVSKFSNKGVFTKTWEGELVMGGVRSSSDGQTAGANVWAFSVDDLDLTTISNVIRANELGAPVRLGYYEIGLVLDPSAPNTNYRVTNVTFMDVTTPTRGPR